MIKHKVEFKDEGATFEIRCSSCPLISHFEAIGAPAAPCVAGVMTNMQGPVPVKSCQHYVKDSIANVTEDNSLSIICRKGME